MFDVIYLGTSVQDCMNVREMGKIPLVMVVDPNGHYGNTWSSRELGACRSLSNLETVGGEDVIFYIEESVSLLRLSDGLVKVLVDSKNYLFLDFVPIKKMYFVENGQAYSIPTTREEIAFCDFLSSKEKLMIQKAMKLIACGELGKDEAGALKVLLDSVTEKGRRIFLGGITGFSTVNSESVRMLKKFVENFGRPQYLYPTYQLKTIAEILSRCNAVNGVAYLVSRNVGIEGTPLEFDSVEELREILGKYMEEREAYTEKHKARIRSEFGNITGKLFLKKRETGEKRHYYVFLLSEALMDPNHVAVYNIDGEYTYSLHLRLDAEKEVFALYFWSDLKRLTREDVGKMKVPASSILAEVAFTSSRKCRWYTTDE